MLKFYQITDLHYYPARELQACGQAWETRAKYDQKCLAESEAILDAVFEKLADDEETQIVLITGDVVCDGELAGHRSLADKLNRLQQAGKKIFLITASHDIRPDPKGYSTEKGEYIVEAATKAQLFDIYYNFGLRDALSIHKATNSYCAQLDDGYRLLALNDDRAGWGSDNYGFTADQLAWAKTQLETAKAQNQQVIAVCHHPVLSPVLFYKSFCPFELVDDAEEVAAFLADNGVHFLFTGHTHMQSINAFESGSGNKLYEINTACLTAYPSPIRKMELRGNTLRVNTEHVETIHYDLHALPYLLYLKKHFDFMLEDIFDAAAHDVDRFIELGENNFSLRKEKAQKFRLPLRFAGRFLDGLTFKKAGKMLGVLSKIAPRLYNVRICDFLIALVNNVYGGTRNFAPGSAEYDAFMAICDRLFKLLPLKDLKEKYKEEIRPILCDILYNANGLDSNDTVITL